MMAVCLSPTSCVARVVAGTVFSGVADALSDAAGSMVTTMFAWWTRTSLLRLDTPLMHQAQRYVITWIAVPVAVLGILAAVIWGLMSSSPRWIADVGRGLLVFGVVSAGSLPIVQAIQDWTTGLATGLLHAVPTHDVGRRFLELLALNGAGPITIMFWSMIVLVAAAIQYLLMLFRDGAILILTAILPLAAAGQFSRGSVLWLPKVVGWLLAFLFLKPAAALIYYLGLSLIGTGHGVQALATGVCMMLTAIFALPALLRLVSFAVTAAPMGSAALSTAATLAGIGASTAQAGAASAATRAAAGTGTGSGSRPSGAAPRTGTGSAPSGSGSGGTP